MCGNRFKFMAFHIFTLMFLWSMHTTDAASDDHPWCYNEDHCEPAKWGGKCHTGKAQSPIDINPSNTVRGRKIRRMRFNREYVEAYGHFIVKNNGHTLQISLNNELSSHLMVDGDGIRGSYVFSQMHFHWGSHNDVGSEHTVSGSAFTAELHLVHYHDRYDSLTAAVQDNNPRALTVLGIFLQIAKDDNVALKPILEAMKRVERVSDSIDVKLPLNVSAFLPHDLGLFRYEGSLTTPGCAEVVLWNVFRHPITISQAQIDAFRNMKDAKDHGLVDNFRPTQNTNNRKVFEYDHGRFEVKPGPNEIDDNKPLDDSLDDAHDSPHPPNPPTRNATTVDTRGKSHGGNSAPNLKAGFASKFSFISHLFTYLTLFLQFLITTLFTIRL